MVGLKFYYPFILKSTLITLLCSELSSDPTIRTHLAALYDTLLEQNLLRIVEPYSVVEVEYVAQQVGQGRQNVESKYVCLLLDNPRARYPKLIVLDSPRLSQMILDKVFLGVLDQGRGCLLVFDEMEGDVSIYFIHSQVTAFGLTSIRAGNVRSCNFDTLTGREGRRFVVRKGKQLDVSSHPRPERANTFFTGNQNCMK